jgi:MGT family glycosyltransferase
MNGSVVVVCMYGTGHMHCLLPVIHELAGRGLTVHVMTRDDLRASVESAGGRYIDLYDGYPIDAADSSSMPVPSRNVSFAGVYAERLARDVAELAPDLIVYDTFSVVAPVVARELSVPYVNVTPNHAPVPERVVAAMRDDPRVSTSAECRAAVERLRAVHGMREANPFSYLEALSPHLNLYPEPEEFLAEGDRAAFEPLAFFGLLAPSLRQGGSGRSFESTEGGGRLFASFGTVVWTYYASEALAALSAVASAAEQLGLEAVLSLAGHPLGEAQRAELARPGVRVVDYADQWEALGAADLFVTHNGMNSTHEAIYHEVPMLSYPFFGDQPALARRCQELGLALPLADQPRAELSAEPLRSAIARVLEERELFAARLAEARSWELRTMAAREEIVDRLLALISAEGGAAPEARAPRAGQSPSSA